MTDECKNWKEELDYIIEMLIYIQENLPTDSTIGVTVVIERLQLLHADIETDQRQKEEAK